MTKNNNAVVLDELFIEKARDGFLALGEKVLLNDEELWTLVQAAAQYIGVVEAHRYLRKIVGETTEKIAQADSSFDPVGLMSALYLTSQIIDVVGEGYNPINIESMVLDGKPGEGPYKELVDSLLASIDDVVQYRSISKKPHYWLLGCGPHRIVLPKGTKVVTNVAELLYGRRLANDKHVLLKAQVERPYQRGIITRDDRATEIQVLECISRYSHITEYFKCSLSEPDLREAARDRKHLVGQKRETIHNLWIDLKENPKTLRQVVAFMAHDEWQWFVESRGGFKRETERPLYGNGRAYVIPKANIFR